MMNEEKVKELLGEFYINYKSVTDKKLYVATINKFINNDMEFLPFESYEKSLKIQATNIRNFIKNNGERYKLLELNHLVFDIYRELKDGITYCNNNLFVVYDTVDKLKKIFVLRGRSGIKEINATLGIGTLRKLYKMFVYDVISYKILHRRVKLLYDNMHSLISDKKFYYDKNNENEFKIFRLSCKSDINTNYSYFLFNHAFTLYYCNYDETLTYVNQKSQYFHSKLLLEEFLYTFPKNILQITNKDELSNVMKRHYDNKILKLIECKEKCDSLIDENNFF